MADLVEDYLNRLTVRNFSEATIKAYRQDLTHAQAFIGRPLLEAKEADLERYMASLHRAGLKPATIRRRQASLRGFFDHARRRKKIKVKPTDNLEAPKMEDRVPVHMAGSQVERLKSALSGDGFTDRRDAAIVLCLYYTGMRSGELVTLTLEDIDLDERELVVMGKGKKQRKLPIAVALVQALRRWLEVHPTGDGHLFVGARFPHAPLEYQGVRKVVGAAMERAGLKGRRFTPHKLRHTFATGLLAKKMPIDKIQKLLGHSRIETTTIYAHTQLEQSLGDEIGDAL